MKRQHSWRDSSMILSLLGVWLFFYLCDAQFVSSRNLSNLAIEFSIIATLSLGMLLVILPGQIDLSVGSGVGLTGGIASVLIFNSGWPAAAAMLVTLAIALILWFCIGKLITSQQLPAFIITLGGLLIFKGLFWKIIDNQTVPVTVGDQENLLSLIITYDFSTTMSFLIFTLVALSLFFGMIRSRNLKRELNFENAPFENDFLKVFVIIQVLLLMTIVMTKFQGLPLVFILFGAVALAIYILTQHTTFGRYLYAIGGNKEAAELSGIQVNKVITKAFMILGALVAITGFMQTSYQGYSTTTIGNLMELDAIAACVIGGVSLAGGRGTVGGVLLGALLMTSLINGMNLLSVAPEAKFIARGTVLVLAVWMDIKFSKKI
jgi:D-xylose transport system permease protein